MVKSRAEMKLFDEPIKAAAFSGLLHAQIAFRTIHAMKMDSRKRFIRQLVFRKRFVRYFRFPFPKVRKIMSVPEPLTVNMS